MLSEEWRWLSDNSTVNVSIKGAWPWAPGEPGIRNLENCGQMYKTYGGSGQYNDIPCGIGLILAGYIYTYMRGLLTVPLEKVG